MHKRTLIIIFVLLIAILVFSGCSAPPTEKPSEIADQYFSYIKDGKYDKAYEMIVSLNQETNSKEDFIKLYSISNEIETIKDYKITEGNTTGKKVYDDKKFNHTNEIDIKIDYIDNNDLGKTKERNQKLLLVEDNKKWMIYYPSLDIKDVTEKLIDDALSRADVCEIAKQYFQYLIDDNAEAAFDLLFNLNKDDTTFEDFKAAITYDKELEKLLSSKVTLIGKPESRIIKGIRVDKAVDVNITLTYIDYTDSNKERTDTYKRTMVAEGAKWKYYRDFNGKENLSYKINSVGHMYMIGSGKEKNYNEAMRLFREALKYYEKNVYAYYNMSYIYLERKEYNSAKGTIVKFIDYAEDDTKFKSDGYNLLGNAYAGLNQDKDAISSYRSALQLDSTNEYARNNLKYYGINE